MNAFLTLAATLLLAAAAAANGGGEGLRAPATATPGSTIKVEVATNDCTIEVGISGSNHMQSLPVAADKSVTVPVPNGTPGQVLVIRAGRGARARVIRVELVAP